MIEVDRFKDTGHNLLNISHQPIQELHSTCLSHVYYVQPLHYLRLCLKTVTFVYQPGSWGSIKFLVNLHRIYWHSCPRMVAGSASIEQPSRLGIFYLLKPCFSTQPYITIEYFDIRFYVTFSTKLKQKLEIEIQLNIKTFFLVSFTFAVRGGPCIDSSIRQTPRGGGGGGGGEDTLVL